MSGKSRKKKPTYEMSMTKAVSRALIIFTWAFVSEFSPEPEMMERLRDQIISVRDSILCGDLTIAEVRKALKDDYNWDVS